MLKTLQHLVITASILGTGTIVSLPAFALTLQNPSVSGTAPYLTYGANAGQTFLVSNTQANLQQALTGNSSNPTGNVELFSNSEQLSNAAFANYSGVTNLQGTLGGKSIVLSSLTFADWNMMVTNTQTLAQKWFDDLIAANNLTPLLGANSPSDLLAAFIAGGGLQKFSDPNISYVNQDPNGTIQIGLAGHFNATPLLQLALQPTQTQLQSAFNTAQAALNQMQTALTTLQQAKGTAQTQLTQLNNQLQVAPANQKMVIQQQINGLTIQIATLNTQITNLNNQIGTTLTQIAGISAKLNPLTALINNQSLLIQASELVKVSYNGGPAQYLYSFNATHSGLVGDDGFSHNGNYQVSLAGSLPPKETPEPSALLGLLAMGGMAAAKRKMTKSTLP
ncbi:MAG: NF038130 family PEP-CTERM protein [Scytolyngbya sp. HA4215-MV1]|jgi:flagellar biosynthesis chaperone FliJ|nr:NF038130 family PEP-CTERM protein [Scytolyngbya sp. HA4215-MV1]